MKRLLLLALLLAAPAWGATKYVRQTAAGTASGSDTTNWMALSTFNATCAAGDVAILQGTFSTTPVPNVSGTSYAAMVTYKSITPGNPGNVTINGGITVSGATGDSLVLWRDLTFGGSVDLGSTTLRTGRWVIRNCRSSGGLNFVNCYGCRVDSCTFARGGEVNGQYGLQFQSGTCGDTTNCYPARDSVTYTSITLTNASFSSFSGCFLISGRDHYLSHSRFSVTTSTGSVDQLRFARFAGCQRIQVYDCYFYGNNRMSGGGTGEAMWFSFKDGMRLGKLYRDTIIVVGNSSPTSSPTITFGQAADAGAIGGNTFRDCYIANRTDADWPISWTYEGFDGDSIVGNTFVANGGPVDGYYSRGNGAVMGTNTIVDHNLFVTFSHGAPALRVRKGTTSVDQGVMFTNNIFYQARATNADTSTARAASMGNVSDWTANTYGPILSDYNLGAAPYTSTKRTVSWNSSADWYGRTGAGSWSVANGTAQDLNSRWGIPALQDTTLASFDAHPLAGSASLFGPDGYVGPFNLAGGDTTWTVTASAGAHGTVTPSGALPVADGGTQQLNLAPATGYYVASITVDGVTSTDPNDWQQDQYSFTNITANHTFACTFAAITSQITVSAGAHGSISPTTAAYSYGASQTFTITPDASYSVLDVTVDGVPQGAITSYAFTNIITAHTISATFVLTASNYVITATSSGSGTLSPSGGVSVASGGSQAFTFTANSGWYVGLVLVDGVSVSISSPYTFSNVVANHTLAVTFVANELSITASAGDNGTISNEGITFVAGGADKTYIVLPDPLYAIADVLVDGVSVGKRQSYTFTNVTVGHTIEASFTSEPRHGGSGWRRRYR